MSSGSGSADEQQSFARRSSVSVESKISQVAVNDSARAGEPSPKTLRWVASNRRDANRVLSGAGIDDDQPVFAMQVTSGVFKSRRGGPHGVRGPEPGRVLSLVVSQETFAVLDRGIGHQTRDLSSLGAVRVHDRERDCSLADGRRGDLDVAREWRHR